MGKSDICHLIIDHSENCYGIVKNDKLEGLLNRKSSIVVVMSGTNEEIRKYRENKEIPTPWVYRG